MTYESNPWKQNTFLRPLEIKDKLNRTLSHDVYYYKNVGTNLELLQLHFFTENKISETVGPKPKHIPGDRKMSYCCMKSFLFVFTV